MKGLSAWCATEAFSTTHAVYRGLWSAHVIVAQCWEPGGWSQWPWVHFLVTTGIFFHFPLSTLFIEFRSSIGLHIELQDDTVSIKLILCIYEDMQKINEMCANL